ncbi:unnamed protein product [Gongylonema pulchrum]|uniref:Kaptin n=1 Tax=Gongylonema pulchrum TaxID=637853 RepID=A0A183EKV9_9BILA|nr:unnamed protein product [Gongylonema pulchrum]
MSSSRAPEPNLLFFTESRRHTRLESAFKSPVTTICFGKLRQAGLLLFFTESRRHTRLENAFKSPVTTICFGKLRQAGDEIAAISANGQIRSFDFPRLDDADGELQKPLPFFEQLVLANICVSHIADIDGDGLSELIVVMTDRCGKCFFFLKNLLLFVSGTAIDSLSDFPAMQLATHSIFLVDAPSSSTGSVEKNV